MDLKIGDWFIKSVVKKRENSNFPLMTKKVRKKEFNSKTKRKTREGVFYCCSLFTQENVCEIRFNKLECDESFTFGFQDNFTKLRTFLEDSDVRGEFSSFLVP